jgi:hypothetical protein
MFSRLNHLAIVSDHYTLLGMFYRAVFGMKAIGPGAEGPVRRDLPALCPHGSYQLTDPDGTWIDVAEG